MKNRNIEDIIISEQVIDGAGVSLNRTLGTNRIEHLDPFLLFDEFKNINASQYISGFPDHPHRGIETITYMLSGSMHHGDNIGNSGILEKGDVQWMTAGKGIIHSEMPEQIDGLLWGLQLWVNLPSDKKMIKPSYQEVKGPSIPELVKDNGIIVKIIAGEVEGVRGAIAENYSQVSYLDISLPNRTIFNHTIAKDHSVCAFVIDGTVEMGFGSKIKTIFHGQLGVFGAGEDIQLCSENGFSRVILISGKPHNEQIVRYGPFVMNTREQIAEAIEDYRTGNF